LITCFAPRGGIVTLHMARSISPAPGVVKNFGNQ